MSVNKDKEIQQAAIIARSKLPIDFAAPYQSMTFSRLSMIRGNTPLVDFVKALESMDGVHIDEDDSKIRIPTSYFK